MWILLFVYMYEAKPYVEEHSKHSTMVKCFQAREALGKELTNRYGYFDPGQQAICVEAI